MSDKDLIGWGCLIVAMLGLCAMAAGILGGIAFLAVGASAHEAPGTIPPISQICVGHAGVRYCSACYETPSELDDAFRAFDAKTGAERKEIPYSDGMAHVRDNSVIGIDTIIGGYCLRTFVPE